MGYQNEPISYSRIWTGKIKKGAEAFDGKCLSRPSILRKADNKVLQAKVPIKLEGKEFLSKKGIVIQNQKESVNISCKAEDLPKAIDLYLKGLDEVFDDEDEDSEMGFEEIIEVIEFLKTKHPKLFHK